MLRCPLPRRACTAGEGTTGGIHPQAEVVTALLELAAFVAGAITGSILAHLLYLIWRPA